MKKNKRYIALLLISIGIIFLNDSWKNRIYAADELSISQEDIGELIYINNGWFLYKNNKINKDYEGLVYYNGGWFYVSQGEVDWSYIGIQEYNGGWFYVENGVVNWSFSGIVSINGDSYNIVNGVVQNGLYASNGLTYYFKTESGELAKNEFITIDNKKYYFDSQGRMTEAPIYKGIDVSHWQGNIDWKNVKNDKSNIDFAMIKVAGREIETGKLYYDENYKKILKELTSKG